MPNAYKDYCYPTLEDAAMADIANADVYMFTQNGTTLYGAASHIYGVYSDTTVFLELWASNGSIMSPNTLVKTYPLCSTVGYLRPPEQSSFFAGVTLSDVVATSWLVVGVWVAAWSIKNIRRGVR